MNPLELLDNKLLGLFAWLHNWQHTPRCTPMRGGLDYRCNCGQVWVSGWDDTQGFWKWVEVPK